MRDTTSRLLRAGGWDRADGFAVISEAVWWVTMVDATLVRYHPDIYGGLLAGQAGAGMVPGDFDNDCDVDAADFQHFRSCALGAGVVQTNPACADARLDADADVDMDDFGIFQRCYSGQNHPANPTCAQ